MKKKKQTETQRLKQLGTGHISSKVQRGIQTKNYLTLKFEHVLSHSSWQTLEVLFHKQWFESLNHSVIKATKAVVWWFLNQNRKSLWTLPKMYAFLPIHISVLSIVSKSLMCKKSKMDGDILVKKFYRLASKKMYDWYRKYSLYQGPQPPASNVWWSEVELIQ